MMILSSEQQDKLIDALDRPAEPVAGQTPAGKQGKLMKVGVGMVTLRGSDAKNTAKSGEAEAAASNPAAEDRRRSRRRRGNQAISTPIMTARLAAKSWTNAPD